jgi:hypothetical protein
MTVVLRKMKFDIQRHRGDDHMKVEANTGVMLPQSRNVRCLQKLTEAKIKGWNPITMLFL